MEVSRGFLPEWVQGDSGSGSGGSGDDGSGGYGYGGSGDDGSGGSGGYGYGYGGSGDRSTHTWVDRCSRIVARWPQALQQRFSELEETADVLAFWRSDANGLPINGGRSDMTPPAVPGLIQEIAGPLHICTDHALHATMLPDKWKGERLWIVALFGEIQQQNDKFAALKREIVGEVPCS